MEYKWSQKHLKLDPNLEELDILADEALLKQVWINLLDNGIKFSPEFGKLSVSLHTKDGTCIAKVQDHGPGMDQATSDLIFTKFYQGDTSHQSEGNGLGLALVKKIIELHRGTVTVESNTGKGSTSCGAAFIAFSVPKTLLPFIGYAKLLNEPRNPILQSIS